MIPRCKGICLRERHFRFNCNVVTNNYCAYEQDNYLLETCKMETFGDKVNTDYTNLDYNDEEYGNDYIDSNVFESYENIIRDRQNSFDFDGTDVPKQELLDRPKTFIREFLMEERKRNESLKANYRVNNTTNKSSNSRIKSRGDGRSGVSNRGKCYTCNPRKKVMEHIIQNCNGITFHHDMCNRNIIVATPDAHYSTFEQIPVEQIGILFREIHLFCKNWNINDYCITYNQGQWQTHKHFHVKIRTYDALVNRMRGDHFRLLSFKKTYDNAVL